MDGPHYSAKVINTSTASYPSTSSVSYPSTSTASYPSPSAVSPHQLQQQHQHLPPQTLPPLQSGNHVMQNAYGSYPHTPRTPATPNTPGNTNNMTTYPPPPTQNAGRGGYQMMQNNPYQQPQQPYPATSAMMQQTTAAHAPIAPAPSPGGRVPPMLRPMPAGGVGGVMPQPGMNSPYGQSPLMPQPQMMPEGDTPTHVVGSQGRRGILPSAPGRPAAPVAGGAAKSQVPQKDADGKFPCPHCTKTYLHAKHLKRHLLRHTGDRPYMCVLCRDTFSRSDILKRHFQKCSIRRGNPSGVSHLSHPQAHVKKNAAAQKAAMGNEGDANHINGMGNMPADGMVPFGLMPAPDGMNNIANEQSQLSRSSSMNRLDDANRDRRSMPNSVMGGASTRGNSYDQSYNGDVANNMSSNINPQLANYSMPPAQNGLPMFGSGNSTQQSIPDWAQMFQAGAQNTYDNTFPPNVRQTQTAIKQEPNDGSARADGISGTTSTHSAFFPDWGVPSSSSPDPYQTLSTQLLDFFHSPGTSLNPTSASRLSIFFAPSNIKDFLEKYTHFHAHFAMIHIPTFRVTDAYVGLLAGMCCIGACYSDLVSAANVREIADYFRSALEASSRIYSENSSRGDYGVKQDYVPFGHARQDLEELQAAVISHVLLTWHGSPSQRERARQSFPSMAHVCRKAGLLRVCNDPSVLYSHLHQPDFSDRAFSAANFDWQSWVEQEKRVRLLFSVFLCDASLGLYFNTGPEFETMELKVPVPADDAAWDASSATECAEALGLYGPQLAREKNPDGTQRCRQPEIHLVLKALLHGSYQIQPGTTNLYGKFIIIHALLAMLRRIQLDGNAALLNRSNTPLPQHDWIVGIQSSTMNSNNSNSGRATPVNPNGSLLDGATLKAFVTALDKFKSNWDIDMASQFPPSTVIHPRRYGFSRDGIHFYYLAKYLLKTLNPADLQMAPDQRFAHVIQLLKSVREWVLNDGASRGEELGSVGEIDKDYGLTDLTLDMAQLFKPLPRVVESPEIPSVKTELGIGNGGIM